MVATAESTKDRLLTIARDLYLEVGPEAFSLREVARRAQLTAPAIYRHFDSKDALLGAVCEEGFRIFASYLLRALAKAKPRERLRETGMQYMRFGLERPRDYRVIFMSDIAPRQSPRAPKAEDPTFRFLVDRVRECMDAKILRRADPRETAVTIWAHVHGLVSLRLAGHLAPAFDTDDFESLYARSTDHLLAGLSR